MTSITETPHAEDLADALEAVIIDFRYRGLSDEWIIILFKDAIEKMGKGF